jgi:glycine/D-amino acid oxidase-like deaminating enzyme
MKTNSTDVVICGAGIAGVSAAYFLSLLGVRNIILVDELPPLNLTSSRSTECYRNWWPDPEMLALMNRSIDLLEGLADKSGNIFSLNRRGYLFVTADQNKISDLKNRAGIISRLGAGPLRIHDENQSTYIPHHPEGYIHSESGADLLLGSTLIRKHFPYLAENSEAALHVRRAGWLSAQQLGMYLLNSAREKSVLFTSAKVTAVNQSNNEIESVELSSGDKISTRVFINAAGPYFGNVGRLCGFDLPVFTELHLKVAFKDPLEAIRRDAPLLIWDDTQTLEWEKDERTFLANDPETRWLTEPFPSGAHTRPEGGPGSQAILMLWEYQSKLMDPLPDPPLDDYYPEVALRGMARMIPALKGYFGRSPRPNLDGGFYTKSDDNRPIVGPTPIKGVYLLGALSGYGIMAACGVGELLAHYIAGRSLPGYAKSFSLERFSDPAYLKWMESITDKGQL